MDSAWPTYAEVAARLGLSVEAVRQRAIRNKWARTLSGSQHDRNRLRVEWLAALVQDSSRRQFG